MSEVCEYRELQVRESIDKVLFAQYIIGAVLMFVILVWLIKTKANWIATIIAFADLLAMIAKGIVVSGVFDDTLIPVTYYDCHGDVQTLNL